MAVVNLTSNNFANVVLKSDKPSLVLFWAMGNPRNELWDKLIYRLDALGRDDLNVCKVSVNYAPHIPMRFHIASYPSVALFRGKELVGVETLSATMDAMKNLLAKLDETPAPQEEAPVA